MKVNTRQIVYIVCIIVISILAFTEINFITNYKDTMEHEAASSWFLITSISIGMLTLIMGAWFPSVKLPQVKTPQSVGIVILIITAALLVNPLQSVFQKFPFHTIDATQSDIMPQITTMVGWFLQGVFPYQPITDWGYELFPTYLPMTWMPFIIPYLFHLDYRIFAMIIFFAGLYTAFRNNQNNLWGQIIAALFVYYLFKRISVFEDTIIGYTIESMIAGFYLIFISTWDRNNKYWMVLGLLLCLLSRYALIVWLPVYFIFLWRKFNFRLSFQTGILTLAGIGLLYILPFVTQDTSIYQKGMDHHSKAAINEWKGQPWQEDKTKPYSLYKGVGMASRFYEQEDLMLEQKLERLQKFHIGLLLSVVFLCTLITWIYYSKLINPKLFLLGTFKIYLGIFYHFIQIPYTYLYIVLITVSIPIMLHLWSSKEQIGFNI